MVKLQVLDDSQKVQLIFEEELTINNVEEAKTIIDEAFENFEDIDIVCQNVRNLDLTFLQLFYAMYQTGKNENKMLNFNFNFSEELENLIKMIGFDKVLTEIKNT